MTRYGHKEDFPFLVVKVTCLGVKFLLSLSQCFQIVPEKDDSMLILEVIFFLFHLPSTCFLSFFQAPVPPFLHSAAFIYTEFTLFLPSLQLPLSADSYNNAFL